MIPVITNREGLDFLADIDTVTLQRYASWFHELDAWTEYWDIYHPESKGRYYFGDGHSEQGLLTQFLPRFKRPPVFAEWLQMASLTGSSEAFSMEVRVPAVAAAVLEVDALIHRLFGIYFGDATDPAVKADYLQALFCFATDSFPPAAERYSKISDDDPRKSTSGRNTLEGDIMWFAWALQVDAAMIADEATASASSDPAHQRRSLQLAGIAVGCSANFTWRGHRRTRKEYRPDATTARLLLDRGATWATDPASTAMEIYALYRIREWGDFK
jgi:hypothetical protein